MVLRSAEAVEPLGDRTVPLRAIGTWDLAVRRRRGRARARTRTRSLPRATSAAGGARNPCARVSAVRSSRSGSRPIELAQKTLPTTAASCRRLFSESGSPSRRAAMMPWSVSGSGSSSVEPCSRIQLDELLGVEGIAAGALEQGLLGLRPRAAARPRSWPISSAVWSSEQRGERASWR